MMAPASTKLTEADWLSHKHKVEIMVVGERQNNETILKNLKLLGFEAK